MNDSVEITNDDFDALMLKHIISNDNSHINHSIQYLDDYLSSQVSNLKSSDTKGKEMLARLIKNHTGHKLINKKRIIMAAIITLLSTIAIVLSINFNNSSTNLIAPIIDLVEIDTSGPSIDSMAIEENSIMVDFSEKGNKYQFVEEKSEEINLSENIIADTNIKLDTSNIIGYKSVYSKPINYSFPVSVKEENVKKALPIERIITHSKDSANLVYVEIRINADLLENFERKTYARLTEIIPKNCKIEVKETSNGKYVQNGNEMKVIWSTGDMLKDNSVIKYVIFSGNVNQEDCLDGLFEFVDKSYNKKKIRTQGDFCFTPGNKGTRYEIQDSPPNTPH